MTDATPAPPGYVEVTEQVRVTVATCEQLLERIKLLRQADTESAALIKQVADATRPTHAQGKPYYRAGFGWRSSRALQYEQQVLELIGKVLPAGSTVQVASGVELTVLHCHLTPSWHSHPHSLEVVTWELGTQDALHLATLVETNAGFLASLTPDEPTD